MGLVIAIIVATVAWFIAGCGGDDHPEPHEVAVAIEADLEDHPREGQRHLRGGSGIPKSALRFVVGCDENRRGEYACAVEVTALGYRGGFRERYRFDAKCPAGRNVVFCTWEYAGHFG